MDFDEFKRFHLKHSASGWKDAIGREMLEYFDAMSNNPEYYEWAVKNEFEQEGFDYTRFCCLTMAINVHDYLDEDGVEKPQFNENGERFYDDGDVIVDRWEEGIIGIAELYGGTSLIEIHHCPWCGTNLRKNE